MSGSLFINVTDPEELFRLNPINWRTEHVPFIVLRLWRAMLHNMIYIKLMERNGTKRHCDASAAELGIQLYLLIGHRYATDGKAFGRWLYNVRGNYGSKVALQAKLEVYHDRFNQLDKKAATLAYTRYEKALMPTLSEEAYDHAAALGVPVPDGPSYTEKAVALQQVRLNLVDIQHAVSKNADDDLTGKLRRTREVIDPALKMTAQLHVALFPKPGKADAWFDARIKGAFQPDANEPTYNTSVWLERYHMMVDRMRALQDEVRNNSQLSESVDLYSDFVWNTGTSHLVQYPF